MEIGHAVVNVSAAQSFAVALLIGALVGIEREKRKGEKGFVAFGGLRTYALLSLVGGVSAWLSIALQSPWLFVSGTVSVTLLILASYLSQVRADPTSIGLASEITALITYLLGGMTLFGHMELAVGLAIIISALLAYKQPLHGLVSEIAWEDIFAGLRLLMASFIILPLLPNRTIDPLGALNPYELWLLVILISGLSLIGYVASRIVGTQRGTVLTAITGALASSTAVTLALAKQAGREVGKQRELVIVSGILVAWGVMFVRVLIEVAIVNPYFLPQVVAPLVAMGTVVFVWAAVLYKRSTSSSTHSSPQMDDVKLTNPFSLTEAGKFAFLFAFVLVLVRLAEQHLFTGGIYAVAALAGLTDVDAITLSMAQYAALGQERTAAIAIVLAVVSNTLVKCSLVAYCSSREARKLVIEGSVVTVLIGLVTVFLWQ